MITPDLVNPSFAKRAWWLGDGVATHTVITRDEATKAAWCYSASSSGQWSRKEQSTMGIAGCNTNIRHSQSTN